MEECKDSKKRERVDSTSDTPELKRIRVNSNEESGSNSPEFIRIPDDLLEILDDSETVVDRDPAIQGLDSVIRSFEEEILLPPPAGGNNASNSGGSRPELGYLLEASDDELGLPPTFSSGEQDLYKSAELPAVVSDAVGIGGIESDIPSYDSFGFGIGVDSHDNNSNSNSEFVTVGRLFDYSESGYDPADFSDYYWWPGTLPAL